MQLTGGLEHNLALFVKQLRQEGLPVGTAELLEALRALQQVDISRRSMFKTALQATLVKSYRHRDTFSRVFDSFFVAPELARQRRRQEQEQRARVQAKLQEASRDFQFKGEPLRLSEEEMLLYTSLPEERRRRIQNFVRETEAGHNVEAGFRPILETVVKGHLRYWRNRDHAAGTSAGSGPAVSGGAGSGRGGNNLREMDIQQIAAADLPAAVMMLNRFTRRLAQTLQRRRLRQARRGVLDMRGTLRANLSFGGSPYRLKYRHRSRSRLRLLLICDVSASMQRYSAFVLQLIYGLQAAVRNLESFVFADSLEYLTPSLRQQGYLQNILDRVVRKSEIWGGGTNLAAALEVLLKQYGSLCDHRTTALIVSDTRTVAMDAAVQAVRDLRDRIKRIIWLNTLPGSHWSRYRSVEAFASLADMWPCHTIADLERVAAGLFTGYKQDLSIEGGIAQP